MHEVAVSAVNRSGPVRLDLAGAPVRLLRMLIERRDLIRQFVRRDLRHRTRGTQFGMLWDLLNPLMMLCVYTLVFSSILKVRLSHHPDEGPLQYAIYLFAGLTAFQVFAEPLGRSGSLITSKRNFVKKMAFPLEIFAIVSALTALVHASLGLAIVLLAALVLSGGVGWTALLLPVVLLPGVLMGIAVGWAFGAIGVYFRDIQQFLGSTVTRLLFFLTPIIYSIDAVPAHLRWVLHLNPLTVVVDGVRRVVLQGRQPDWGMLGIWIVGSSILVVLSYALFMRVRRGFADVI